MRSFPGVGLGHRALKHARYCAIVFGAASHNHELLVLRGRGYILNICVCAFVLSFNGRENESEREREREREREWERDSGQPRKSQKHLRSTARWLIDMSPSLRLHPPFAFLCLHNLSCDRSAGLAPLQPRYSFGFIVYRCLVGSLSRLKVQLGLLFKRAGKIEFVFFCLRICAAKDLPSWTWCLLQLGLTRGVRNNGWPGIKRCCSWFGAKG